MAPRINAAVPIVPVRDVRKTVAFYVETLGFESRHLSPDGGFGIVTHGPVAIQLLRTSDPGALEATANNIAIYLWVERLDDLYASLKPALDRLPAGRVRPPFVQDYGMREFHVKDPDGCLLFFGEDVDPAKAVLRFDRSPRPA